jgi:phosphoglycolate phosphatase
MVQTIVFDLDGTLIDSHEMIARTVNRVLVGRGHPPAAADQVHALTGLPLADIFQAVLPAAAAEQALACVDEYRALFDRDVLPALAPIPGAAETVRDLGQRFRLGVATGRLTDTAERMLAGCGLAGRFGSVLGADAVARPKPYPDLLLAVLDELGGVDPRRAVVVGDSGADVAMAHAAGARACAVTWGAQPRSLLLETRPDWCVDTWPELRRVLVGAAASTHA